MGMKIHLWFSLNDSIRWKNEFGPQMSILALHIRFWEEVSQDVNFKQEKNFECQMLCKETWINLSFINLVFITNGSCTMCGSEGSRNEFNQNECVSTEDDDEQWHNLWKEMTVINMHTVVKH